MGGKREGRTIVHVVCNYSKLSATTGDGLIELKKYSRAFCGQTYPKNVKRMTKHIKNLCAQAAKESKNQLLDVKDEMVLKKAMSSKLKMSDLFPLL